MAPLLLKPAVQVRDSRVGHRLAELTLHFAAPQPTRSGRSEFAAGSLADSFRSLSLSKPAAVSAPAVFRVESACPAGRAGHRLLPAASLAPTAASLPGARTRAAHTRACHASRRAAFGPPTLAL